MTLYITDAQITGYHPDSTGEQADYTIPAGDIYSFDVEQKVGALKDTGKLAIDNAGDAYTDAITHGDRIDIYVEGEEIAGQQGYGVGGYGEGPYGGSESVRAWTGMVRNFDFTYHGASECTLSIDAEDFVFGVLGFRKLYNEWRTRPIVGTNGIVNEILMDECPEIDASYLPTYIETTSMSVFGDDAIDVVGELALRLPALPYSNRDALRFDHPDTLSPRFTLTPTDYGVLKIGSEDDTLKTAVRVRGGTAPGLDDQQLTHDGATTVTDSSFATQRIDTRKSFLDQINLWLKADREGEDVIVRLQKDGGDGTGPIAPDDETSDIARKRLSSEFLDVDGFTPFLMPTSPENSLPEPRPWMIVQTDGPAGQQIGSDAATGNLCYQAYYPYPIVVEQSDQAASEKYRRREGDVSKQAITTFEDARDKGKSYLHEHAAPRKTMQLDAQSVRMHVHDIGSAVQITEAFDTGAYVAVEKKDHYEGNQLTTDFSFQSLASIASS